MTYEKIIRQAFVLLQEDPEYANFWGNSTQAGEESETMMYAHEGLREILEICRINLTESTIPLYAHLEQEFTIDGEPVLDPETGEPVFSKKNFKGFYTPPINRIQDMEAIFWKPTPTLMNEGTEEAYWEAGAFQELKVMSPNSMDRLDKSWRTRKTSSTPTHAVLYSGNFDEMNMSQSPLRNNIKIKIYPTPTNIDDNLQELLGSLSGLQTELDARRMSYSGGLMNDSGGDLVWGIDVNGDGERDDIPTTGSIDLGIMVQLLTGASDFSRFGNFPVIRYIPDIEQSIFTTVTTVDGEAIVTWYDLDGLLPLTLQLALRDYICYRCFDKEGEAIDIKKSLKYFNHYEEKVNKYRANNYLYERTIVTSDSNFGFGNNNNRDVLTNTRYNNGYNF